LANWRNAR